MIPMRGFYDIRPPYDARANFALSSDEKRRASELAAREGLPLSAFLRRAVINALGAPANDAGGNRPRAA
jgi:hypothetical protein